VGQGCALHHARAPARLDVSRCGQVWEFGDDDPLMLIFLLLQPSNYSGIRGWDCVNLYDGKWDWIPESCFTSEWWKRMV
jgi:hypothetical protein